MALGEFQQLLEVANIHGLGFQPRQSSLAFRMGMMCQSDESGSSRFQEMTLLEFQMAIGSVAFLAADCQESEMLSMLKRIFKLLLALGKGSKERPK